MGKIENVAMNNTAQQTSTPPVAVQPPEKKAKTAMSHLLQTIGGDFLKADVATEFVDLLSDKQMNMILAKIIDRKQKESNDKDVISYQNVKNNKMMRYLKIPYCKVEGAESFATHSRWVDRAVEISVTTGNKDKDKNIQYASAILISAKRMTKKLMRKYPEAAKEAIVETNMLPEDKKMSALKIASMFKAAQITSIQKRRLLLRHLRHHFGKHAFDTERNIRKIDDRLDPDPEMAAWIAKVNEDACTGPRKSEEEKEAIEEERKIQRQSQPQMDHSQATTTTRGNADGMLHSPHSQRYLDGMMW